MTGCCHGYGGRASLRVLMTVGCCVLVAGALTLGLHQLVYHALVEPELVLSTTSPGFKFWLTTDVPIFMYFYLWNITNADQVLTNAERPRLQQVGPYVYREKHEKVNLTWNSNGTVTYMQVKRWFYEPSLSNGSLSDNITTLNVPLMAASTFIKNLNSFVKLMFNELLDRLDTRVFVTHNVSELLFDGYKDPLLDTALIIEHLVNISIPFDRFGWFYARNNSRSYDGVFTMDTGISDLSQLGRLQLWNGTNSTHAFAPPCNMINGTTAELFSPFLQPSHVQLYSPDICRSLQVPYKNDVTIGGLTSYRFEADERMFAAPHINPDNACFCNGQCPPSGLLNETLCRFGVPAFVSFPHMLYVDEAVRRQTEGQQPDVALHNFSIVVEPTTGVPLNVRARFQINMHLKPNLDVNLLANLPDMYLPLVWFDNQVDTTDAVTQQLHLVARTLPQLLSAGSCVLVALGGAILLVAALVVAAASRKVAPPSDKNAAAAAAVSAASARLIGSSAHEPGDSDGGVVDKH